MTSREISSVHEFDNAFISSRYHQYMAEADARFIHHDPEGLVGSDRYVQILGHDVDQTTHMRRTLALTNSFIRQHNDLAGIDPSIETINEEETQILQLAAISHDWGESLKKDIKYELKTRAQELEEKEAYELIFDELGVGDQELRDKLTAIIFDREGRLGYIFNTIERVGYALTVMRAHRKLTEDDLSEVEVAQFSRLRREVAGRHINTLIERGIDLPVAKTVGITVGNAIEWDMAS